MPRKTTQDASVVEPQDSSDNIVPPTNETTKVKSGKKSRGKTAKIVDSPEAWRDAWYHFFRVGATIRRKTFTQTRDDFQNLGDAWHNLSLQVPFVGKVLKILQPLFAVGELAEKFTTILDVRIQLPKRKKSDTIEEDTGDGTGLSHQSNPPGRTDYFSGR